MEDFAEAGRHGGRLLRAFPSVLRPETLRGAEAPLFPPPRPPARSLQGGPGRDRLLQLAQDGLPSDGGRPVREVGGRRHAGEVPRDEVADVLGRLALPLAPSPGDGLAFAHGLPRLLGLLGAGGRVKPGHVRRVRPVHDQGSLVGDVHAGKLPFETRATPAVDGGREDHGRGAALAVGEDEQRVLRDRRGPLPPQLGGLVGG